MKNLGNHIIIDLYGCKYEEINTVDHIQKLFAHMIDSFGITKVSEHFNMFNPYRISAVLIVKESHITIHTWPEHNFAALDIFLCREIDVSIIQHVIQNNLFFTDINIKEWKRGII